MTLLVQLFRVLPPGTPLRAAAGKNQPIIKALTPGVMFQGLRRGEWVWRLGGGYVEAVSVREVR